MFRPQHFCVLIVLSIGCSSCAFLKLKEDVAYLSDESTITGTVTGASDASRPVVVALVQADDTGNYIPQTYTVRYGSGPFELQNRSGEYYLMAFEDSNEDLSFQANEPLGWWGEPTLLEAGGGIHRSDLTVTLRPPDQARAALPQAYDPERPAVSVVRDTFRLGEVVDLGASDFDDAIGAMGMWEPVKFVQGGHSGLFFLEAYDPDKKPVLFIHGITGTARDWRHLLAGLDRERLQPWLLNYPSGSGIHRVADTVNAMLNELQLTYNFDHMAVVAHSMGGLVARDLINRNVAQGERAVVDEFIAISSPWGGHATAARAASAPIAVPAWYDMAPDGDFLRNLLVPPLPADLPFYLLFSHKGNGLLRGANSDGTITLKSQLHPQAQQQASRIIGFDEDHVSILRAPESIALINELLTD
ncbi:MAG: lipase family alpha/beta hydrolase [Pseudomonadales bacterium]